MEKCPYCNYATRDMGGQIIHMREEHPEIIEARLIEAGYKKDEASGKWIDTLSGD